jgi:CheY-like chemotaxis protein
MKSGFCSLRSKYILTGFEVQMPSDEARSILIIDDDSLHLTLYAWILERQGYRCQTALVGSSSVDMPQKAAFDLALLDYKLNSSVTALEIVHDLRNRFGSIPIVVLSELQWMPDDMRGHAATFVHKGDPKYLLDTIAAVLENKASEEKLPH